MSFRLGRCRVSVSFYFFVMLALAGIFGGGSVLSGISAAGIHEFGHIAAAYLCTGSAVPVSFDVTPFGLRMGVIPACIGKREELCILSGGIAANILASAVFWGLGAVSGSRVLAAQPAAGICMAAVNAAPVQSLDGGRILGLLLAGRAGQETADRAVFILTLVTVFIMALSGAYIFLRNGRNFTLLMLSFWLALRCLRGDADA